MTALLDHLWQSTLFALLPAALTLSFRRHDARTRFWLWFAASIKFLIPFSALMALGGALALPVLPALPDTPTLVVLQQAATPFATAAPADVALTGGMDWFVLLIGIWALGTAMVVLAWGLRHIKLRALIKAARPLAMAAPLPVLISPAPIEPGLVGIFRPVLMLPEGIQARLSQREMNAILAHEFCHFRQRDNLTAAIHMLVEALFWFHPLVWWLERKLMAERERACDEAVLAAGNDPRIFAEGILNVCRFYVQGPAGVTAPLSGANLRARIETILANRAVRRLGRAQKFALAAMALAILGMPILAGRAQAMIDSSDQARIARTYDEQSRPRRAITFNPADFDQYAGTYQGDTVITVSRSGAHFYARRDLGVASNHMTPLREILPESTSSFFDPDRPAQYSFTRDAVGRVNGLVFHQSGLDRTFKRIDAKAVETITNMIAARASTDKPASGTEAALFHYIRTMQGDMRRQSDFSAGIQARNQIFAGATAQLVRNFGALQSLAFKGVSPDGMDLYDAGFAKGHVQWWIAPLTQDGRIIWVGFARALRKG